MGNLSHEACFVYKNRFSGVFKTPKCLFLSRFSKNFGFLNFYRGFNFVDDDFLRGLKFAEFRGLSQNPRNLIPAKFNPKLSSHMV